MTFAITFDNLSADESESEPTTETRGGVIIFMMASVMALLMIFALEGMSAGLHGLVQRNDITQYNQRRKKPTKQNVNGDDLCFLKRMKRTMLIDCNLLCFMYVKQFFVFVQPMD